LIVPRSLPSRCAPRARIVSVAFLSAVVAQVATAPVCLADPGPSSAGAAQPSAEQLADDAYKLHAAGKYAEAIATYLKAYEISNAAPTLYNVATIYDRKLHEPELAIEFYRRYLRASDAEPQWIEKATERITALKAQESEERARLTGPVPPPRAPAVPDSQAVVSTAVPSPITPSGEGSLVSSKSRPSGWRTGGVVLGVTGIAGAGAGLILGYVAKSRDNEANALCNGLACSTERGVTLAQQAGSFATASTIAFVAGLALCGVGTVMYFASPKRSASAYLTVEPQMGTAGGAMILRGGF
jgi:tetratricopeptide (TPR) repeat protein